jgi:hypothetical protein
LLHIYEGVKDDRENNVDDEKRQHDHNEDHEDGREDWISHIHQVVHSQRPIIVGDYLEYCQDSFPKVVKGENSIVDEGII